MTRFAVAMQKVDNLHDSTVVMALRCGLRDGQYTESLTRHLVKKLVEAMAQVQEEIHVDDMYARRPKWINQKGKNSKQANSPPSLPKVHQIDIPMEKLVGTDA